MTRPESGEDAVVDWLRRRVRRRGGAGWIGDDAAVLPLGGSWAVTMDSQIAGVHFPDGLDPAVVARRLLAVNLSDLAAMGAVPGYGFLALSAPRGFDHRRFLRALLAAGEACGMELAGGDLARHSRLTATLTLLGRKPRGGRWLRRGAAAAGETIWLGGPVGEAAAGGRLLALGAALDGRSVRLPEGFEAPRVVAAAARRSVRRHLQPRPQLELGQWLSRRRRGAVIDVSDGLSKDLYRMCRESGTGAEIELERLEPRAGGRRLAALVDRDWKDLALAGGEDYVLLFTLPPNRRPAARFDCRKIGRILAGDEIYLSRGGRRTILPERGWDHLAGDRRTGHPEK